ncbi:hypothetical protein [Clostridium tyrobutyricum]|uniref:hypothetical protein n=1 Tax=Clostridium tyrobutyricum TaxID=1519 RepID=UPI0012D8FEC8|nr:hypothetical protein [Clostridium tyrobutyricum]
MTEDQKKTINKALCALNRLSQGRSSINQIRVEYGLHPIKDILADKLFIAKE